MLSLSLLDLAMILLVQRFSKFDHKVWNVHESYRLFPRRMWIYIDTQIFSFSEGSQPQHRLLHQNKSSGPSFIFIMTHFAWTVWSYFWDLGHAAFFPKNACAMSNALRSTPGSIFPRFLSIFLYNFFLALNSSSVSFMYGIWTSKLMMDNGV